jgi:pyridoxal phosphate enzyme (YggS family)
MLIRPQNYAQNLHSVRARLALAAAQHGRSPDGVTLLAVSKGQPAAAVLSVAELGVENFGENYLQEALPKIDALAGRRLTWHFIGPLQANKTRPIAERFAWVHTLDRLRVAERLAAQRPHYAADLNVCIQVKLGGEALKSGAAPEAVAELAAAVAALPRLKLRGLMCLPPPETDPARQRFWFAQLRRLYDMLNAQALALDTLSMGMSADLEAAVAEGATIVRIGTALFGPRPGPPAGARSTP